MLSRVITYANLVRYQHTAFALPFAYLGAFLAAGGFPSARELVWITGAMVGARSAAMAFNRLIDRAIDARNPRTSMRHLPRGALSVQEVLVFAVLSLGLLALSAFQLNPLCVRLLPVVVPVLVIYAYTKRFTWWCHFFLGAAQFFAPFGGWIAVTGAVSLEPVMLGAVVGLWVAGFDIVYGVLDIEFDRREGIKSIPARFGEHAAFWASRLVHAASFLILAWVYRYMGTGPLAYGGVLAVGALLAYQHIIVGPGHTRHIEGAFLNVNSAVGVVLFAFTAAELLLP